MVRLLFSPRYLAVLALSRGAWGASPPAPAEDIWTAMARLDFKGARIAAEDQTPTDAESRLQAALLLVVAPPQTAARQDEVAARLRALADDPAAGPVAPVAAYQAARLAHTRGVVDDEAIIAGYREVWTRFPGTDAAERAFVFAAMVRQYRAHETTDEKRAALLAWDADAARVLQTDAGRRLYHLAASMAWARLLHDDDQACAHLEKVHAIGLASQFAFSDVIFRLGEYHRRRGDAAGAVRYFREFVERYPVERRTDLARRLIRQLAPDEDA